MPQDVARSVLHPYTLQVQQASLVPWTQAAWDSSHAEPGKEAGSPT